MNGWRFAVSSRWLGYLALVVAFGVACSLLAVWQLARREEARAAIERVDLNWDATPLPLEQVLTEDEAFDPELTWTPVTMSGEYLRSEQLLVRGRPLASAAGFEVLVPFRLADGTVFVVDRGWVAMGNEQDVPDFVPSAPNGVVTVVVRLKPSERTIPGRSAPAGQIATIHLPSIADDLDVAMYTSAFGLLAAEDPAPTDRPAAVVRPVADEGPHLSYAFQWLVFALMGFVALGWAIRREFRIRNEDDPAERARAEKRALAAASRRPTDSQIEDELLDR